MTFRPTLWATIAAGLALLVLIGLGTWQLDRRAWKLEIIENRAQRISTPALAFAEIGDIEATEYRPVQVAGRYQVDRTIKLLSRTHEGRAGFHLITPFETDPANGIVMVDRGWAPVGDDAAIAPAPAGRLAIDGFVRRYEIPGGFTPDNDLAEGTWFYLDRDQLASALDLAVLAPFYVQLAPREGSSGVYPQGGVPNVALRNPHLQYAVTWYALAGVLLVIYVIFHTRRRVGED
ncbi:MAG: SURF1 family protein [Alphaproteobacteria bacterium]|nr:SURF1 family protein [Alphaproteobacteria bacterium]